MIDSKKISFTPFTFETVSLENNRSLLLQCIIYEMIQAKDYLQETFSPDITPFNWTCKRGSANKIQDYSLLLPFAFPDLVLEAHHFYQSIHTQSCEYLFSLIEPFMHSCGENENLLFFLYRHQNRLNIKSILDKMFPQGLDELKVLIIKKYADRGFIFSEIPVKP